MNPERKRLIGLREETHTTSTTVAGQSTEGRNELRLQGLGCEGEDRDRR